MSVVVPATPTPRRSALLHQGIATSMPSFAAFGYDKSPLSLRQHQTYHQVPQSARPLLLHKTSHPLPGSVSASLTVTPTTAVNLLDQTATAPARLPVPLPVSGSSLRSAVKPKSRSKRVLSDNEDEDDDVERDLAHAHNQLQEAVGSGRPSTAKRARRSPPPPQMRPIDEDDGMIYLDDDEEDDQDIVVLSEKPIAPRTASLKRSRAPASPLRPPQHSNSQQHAVSEERAAKKPKVLQQDKRALERDRVERDKFEERFRDKYTRAFPGFKFYFDSIEGPARSALANRVQQLGAVSLLPFSIHDCLFVCHDSSHDMLNLHSASKTSSRPLSRTSSRTNPSRRPRTSSRSRTRRTTRRMARRRL